MKWPYNVCVLVQHDHNEIRTFKSPEMLAPAKMPVAAGKKIANTEKKLSPSRKSGGKFSMKIFSLKKKGGVGGDKTMKRTFLLHLITTNSLFWGGWNCSVVIKKKPSYHYNWIRLWISYLQWEEWTFLQRCWQWPPAGWWGGRSVPVSTKQQEQLNGFLRPVQLYSIRLFLSHLGFPFHPRNWNTQQ